MFQSYIKALLAQTVYEQDENGVVIAKIPNKPGYYAQGDTFEEARENMVDVIETLLIDDIKQADTTTLDKMRNLLGAKQLDYA